MGDDDWLDELHRKRQGRRQKEETEATQRDEKSRILQAKVPALWEALVEELKRLVALYNSGADPDAQVTVPTEPAYSFKATCPSRDKGYGALVLEVNLQQPGLGRLTSHTGGRFENSDVVVTGAEVAFQGVDVKGLARNLLRPFLEGIS